MQRSIIIRGMAAGMVGGLAGTYSMYWFGAGFFALLGWPANTSFVTIGDSAAAFFANQGIDLTGAGAQNAAALGMRLYYLIGLALGAGLGLAVAGFKPLQRLSLKQKVGASVLYVEAMSLPLLAAGALSLKMSAADALLWFAISFAMHLVYGAVLGVIASYGVSGTLPRQEAFRNTTPGTTPNAPFRR